MGISITAVSSSSSSSVTKSHLYTHKVFLLCNYILLGASSACIFLTLSLRLIPSLCGVFFILLHALTIAAAVSGCSAARSGSPKFYAAHMAALVLTSIFQGAVSVLVFTRTADFLGYLRSYVREDDGMVIMRMVGGLCVAVFCFEWLVLGLGFGLRYYGFLEGGSVNYNVDERGAGSKVGNEELKNWPWPFQV